MIKGKYALVRNEDSLGINQRNRTWDRSKHLLLIFGFFLGLFLAWPSTDSDSAETTFNSKIRSSSPKDQQIALKNKSSNLDNEEKETISGVVDGAEDELLSVKMGEFLNAKEDLLEKMKDAESEMISYLKDVVSQVSGGSIIDESGTIESEAIKRLEDKEFNKIYSLAEKNFINGEAAIEETFGKDKKKGSSNLDIVHDVNDKEIEAEKDIRDVIEEESAKILININKDAKEVVAGLVKDLLNIDIFDTDFKVDDDYKEGSFLWERERDENVALMFEEVDDYRDSDSGAVGEELQSAKDAVEYVEMDKVFKAEEELLEYMDKVEKNIALKIKTLVEKLPISMTDKERNSVLKKSIKIIEGLEFKKLESVGGEAVDNAEHNLDEVVEKDEHNGKIVKHIISDIDDAELKAENDVVKIIKDEAENIILSLDEDAGHVAEDVIKDFVGNSDVSGNKGIKD